MKFKFDKNYTTIAVYAVIVAIFTVLCIVVCINISDILGWFGKAFQVAKPLVYACIMAYIFLPLYKGINSKVFAFVEKKKPQPKLRKTLSITFTYIIVVAIVVIFILIIIPQVGTSYTDLQSKISGYIIQATEWLDGMAVENAFFAEQYDKIIASLQDLLLNSYSFFENITPYILGFLSGFVTETKNILLGLVFSIYFLSSKDILKAQFKKVLRAILPDNAFLTLSKIGRLAHTTFSEFIVSKTLDSILIGMLCVALMTLFRLPYAPLISLIVGVMNFIPFVGPFVGAVPGVFIIFISSPIKVIWFLLIIIGIQILDANVIEPKFLGGDTNRLSSFWILVAIIIMGGMFGIVGLFIGVPVFTVLGVLLNEQVTKSLQKKEMSTKTEDYYNQTKS